MAPIGYRIVTVHGRLFHGREERQALIRCDLREIWISDRVSPRERAALVKECCHIAGMVPLLEMGA